MSTIDGSTRRHRLALPKFDEQHRLARELTVLRLVRWVRFIAQSAIGGILVVLLTIRGLLALGSLVGWDCPWHFAVVLHHIPVLTMAGHALFYSAGAELAYMLFTPGPDEAIEPALLGIAATILMAVSSVMPEKPAEPANWSLLVGVLLLSFALYILFYIRKKFLKPLSEVPKFNLNTADVARLQGTVGSEYAELLIKARPFENWGDVARIQSLDRAVLSLIQNKFYLGEPPQNTVRDSR